MFTQHNWITEPDSIENSVVEEGSQPRVTGNLEDDHVRWTESQLDVVSKKLTEYQQHVVEEKRDLDNKLFHLTLFVLTESFYEVSDAEQMRLQRQELLMRLYSQVLGERIAAFK